MPLEGLHGDRERAGSFGSVAERYDRFRPGYPDALVDDLISVRPLDALDVGCGTGKVAVALAERGLRVLGVEPDGRMASVARGHGIRVEVACFEDWDDAGRRFDLITSGHAWHWVEPREGAAKAARLLRPGGAIARFWNYHAIDEHLLVEFEAIYRDLAPGLHVIGRDPTGLPDAHDPFSEDPAFTDTETRTYRWHRAMTAEQWAGLVGTMGDHMRLGGKRLAALQNALSAAVQRSGQLIDVHGGTYLLLARRGR